MPNDYRIALRTGVVGLGPLTPGAPMDDIVVNDVQMFRAEQMNDNSWWVCCYLDNEDYITFHVGVQDGSLVWTVTEFPSDVKYEHEL